MHWQGTRYPDTLPCAERPSRLLPPHHRQLQLTVTAAETLALDPPFHCPFIASLGGGGGGYFPLPLPLVWRLISARVGVRDTLRLWRA